MALVDHGPARIASTIAQYHLKGKNPGWKVVHHKIRSLELQQSGRGVAGNIQRSPHESPISVWDLVYSNDGSLRTAGSLQHKETRPSYVGKTQRQTVEMGMETHRLVDKCLDKPGMLHALVLRLTICSQNDHLKMCFF